MSEGVLIFGMFVGGVMIVIMTLLGATNLFRQVAYEKPKSTTTNNEVVTVTDYNKARAKMRKNS